MASVAAVVIIAFGMAICLPSALERRKRLQSANGELLAVQGAIESVQQQIRGVQSKIAQTQAEIRSLINERR